MSEVKGVIACTSREQNEAALDHWMTQPRFQGLARDEVRRIVGGLGILAEQRMPEDVDHMTMQFTDHRVREKALGQIAAIETRSHGILLAPEVEMTETELKAAAEIALEEAKYWYNMVERYVFDKPILPRLNERLAELARMAGQKYPAE